LSIVQDRSIDFSRDEYMCNEASATLERSEVLKEMMIITPVLWDVAPYLYRGTNVDCPEHVDSKFFRNVCAYIPIHTDVSQQT